MKAVFITVVASSDDTAQQFAKYSDIGFHKGLEPIWALPHSPNKIINLILQVAVLKDRACPLLWMARGRLFNRV